MMTEMKRNTKPSVICNPYFPFVILGLILLLHFFSVESLGDDIFNRNSFRNMGSLGEWIQMRYLTYGSRVLIDTTMLLFCGGPVALWRVANTLMMVFCGVGISNLFCAGDVRKNWLIVFIMVILSTFDLWSAGYISTTVNYIWPIACAFTALLPIRRALNGQKIRWFEEIICGLSLIFAANFEMTAIILAAVYFFFFFYLRREKKLQPIIFILLLILLLDFVFILTCPGNYARVDKSPGLWFPGHNRLNIFQKLDSGFSTAMAQFVNPNVLLSLLLLFQALLVFVRQKDRFYRFIGAFPLAVNLCFAWLMPVLKEVFPGAEKVRTITSAYGLLYVDHAGSWLGLLTFVLLGVVLICILLNFWLIYGNSLKSLFLLLLMMVGLATRVMMGFSPSIIERFERISLNWFAVIIAIVMILFKDIEKSTAKKAADYIFWGLGASALLSYFSLFA